MIHASNYFYQVIKVVRILAFVISIKLDEKLEEDPSLKNEDYLNWPRAVP